MKIKKILLLFVLPVCLASCSKEKIPEKPVLPEVDAGLTIGLSIDTLAIERWLRDCDVFINTARENGAHVIVQNAGNDIEEQNKQIRYLIDRNVDVLVILAKKADALVESVQKARSKNIPVIAYDRLILNADISLYTTVDSQKVGTFMAEGIAKIKPFGNYFCIYGPEEDYNMKLMNDGIRAALFHRNVRIGLTFYTNGWNYDLSYSKMMEMLADGYIPDAILCGNDAIAGSVIRALSEFQLAGKIPVCGQDADIAACQNIVQGNQALTIYKPITDLAKLTAFYACELGRGKATADLTGVNGTISNGYGSIPVVWLDPVPVTKDNIDEIVIKSGFHTHGEVYRNINLE